MRLGDVGRERACYAGEGHLLAAVAHPYNCAYRRVLINLAVIGKGDVIHLVCEVCEHCRFSGVALVTLGGNLLPVIVRARLG